MVMCLFLPLTPSADITSMYHDELYFFLNMICWDRTQVLMFAVQTFHQPGYLSNP